jgi:hypothetical protein
MFNDVQTVFFSCGVFASRAMTCAKTQLHDLMSDVGMKSSGDEVYSINLSNLTTSSSVTSVNLDNGSPCTELFV